MKNNIFRYIFIVIFIGLIIFGIYMIYGKQNEEAEKEVSIEKQEEKIASNIRLGIANFDTINPILSNNQSVQNVSKLIYDSLLNISQDYKIQAGLANEVSKVNATTYLVKLRDNVKFSDGTILEASDVQFTIDQLKQEGMNSIYTNNVKNIIQIDVVDEHTLRIILNEEVPFFEYNLIFPILSRKYFEGEDFKTTNKNNAPIGTGRFKIASNDDKKIILNKNSEWWNIENSNTNLETIEINKYATVSEKYNEFKAGNIDLLHTTNINFEQYAGTIGYSVKEIIGKRTDFLAMNTQNNVLSNIEVRQAINYAINKQNIISSIFNNKYYTSNFPLDFGSYAYKNDAISNEYSQDNAQSVLVGNGWEFKQNSWRKSINYYQRRINLNLVVNESNVERVNVAENIKTQLEEIGIKIDIIKASDAQYYRYLENKNYDMILTGIYHSNSPDLTAFLGNNNYANYYNEEVLNILNEAKNITDDKILKQKYERIYEIYKTEVPYVMLYHNYEAILSNYNLKTSIEANSYNIFYNIENCYRIEK